MQKIVFFDVDGTIVTDVSAGEGKFIPESCKRAIKKARERGNLCFINSGRPYANVEKYILDIGFDGVVSGCGTNIHIGNEDVYHVAVEHEVAYLCYDLCEKYNVTAFFEGRDKTYYIENGYKVEWLDGFTEEIEKQGSIVIRQKDDGFTFDKFCAFHHEKNDITEFLEAVREHFSVIIRDDTFVELVPKGCSKGIAIEKVCEYYKLSVEQSYAIGDSLNDVEMFRHTPNSIGMGNGKAIHDYVSFVTKDISDDGIEFALKHFNII
ncbi:MAG: HAD family hydrolase [Clostridia bacterium]|nr:HAD family hydrolase [Clostridia bacterium]